ncbi:hypothetical protein ACFE04_004433 [Oxalis oulophora]
MSQLNNFYPSLTIRQLYKTATMISATSFYSKDPILLIHDCLFAAHCDTTVARMLVGNKCDLESIRDVSVEEGKSLAEQEGLFFMETSALDSTNVKTAFEMVIRDIYNNVSRKVLNSDTYKAELSVNRVTLSKDGNDGKQSQSYFSCCSRVIDPISNAKAIKFLSKTKAPSA